MGTSNSTGGPGDSTPLLPSWALPSPDAGDGADAPDGDSAADDGGASDDDQDADADGDADAAGNEGVRPDVGAKLAVQTPAYWRSAKARLGTAVSGRGGRAGIARAGRGYVRALGGSRNATRSSPSARGATSRLGGFLSDVASRGVGPALDSLGLGRVAGQDVHTVFAAIVDAIAPEGADIEQAAARDAVNETLAGLFEEYVGPAGDIAALEAMTPEAINGAIEASVAASVFHRWLGDLERQLEFKAVSAAEAVRLERDMGAYIRESVKLDLRDLDPLRMDWGRGAGAALMERIYQEAYSILAGGA
jgi:hypothetical protein